MVTVINNLEIHEDSMLVSINPKVYPIEVVYKAAAPFIRRCFVSIRGDPEEEIIVEFKPKEAENLELAGRYFNNLQGWKVEIVGGETETPSEDPHYPTPADFYEDDVPF